MKSHKISPQLFSMANPTLAKNKEIVEWYGRPFDPKAYDIHWRWSRNRNLPWDLLVTPDGDFK